MMLINHETDNINNKETEFEDDTQQLSVVRSFGDKILRT